MSYFELSIIAFILLGIGVAVWRGGQANPESTGKIARRQAQLDADMKSVKAKVDAIETRVTEIDRRAATIADIERIEGVLADAKEGRDRIERAADDITKSLADVREKVAADHMLITSTAKAVDRIEGYFLQKGTGA